MSRKSVAVLADRQDLHTRGMLKTTMHTGLLQSVQRSQFACSQGQWPDHGTLLHME